MWALECAKHMRATAAGRHQASGVRHQASGIRQQASGMSLTILEGSSSRGDPPDKFVSRLGTRDSQFGTRDSGCFNIRRNSVIGTNITNTSPPHEFTLIWAKSTPFTGNVDVIMPPNP